ncbi:hypothetical protein BpHYR1_017435 [Brachionus plicatilis]|uniref:Uncharacterized protein n=1 Tax=Brachionus plicatilis TaxID=10195 RepID=A0A3M7P4D9_BRAPC|nr:hypothetical protein BpHYR1_017435 [Brachionus plicatilis]
MSYPKGLKRKLQLTLIDAKYNAIFAIEKNEKIEQKSLKMSGWCKEGPIAVNRIKKSLLIYYDLENKSDRKIKLYFSKRI